MPAGSGRPIPTSPNGKKRGSCSPSSTSDDSLPRFPHAGMGSFKQFLGPERLSVEATVALVGRARAMHGLASPVDGRAVVTHRRTRA